jgi:hypothetical protein
LPWGRQREEPVVHAVGAAAAATEEVAKEGFGGNAIVVLGELIGTAG